MSDQEKAGDTKPGPFNRTYLGVIILLVALAAAAWFLTPNRKSVPPLPFSTNGFIATVDPMAHVFDLPPNPTVGQRLGHLLFKLSGGNAHGGSGTSSFPASPVTGCSIQGLLNQCMDVSGTRYLMPIGVAAGSVPFGNTNTLDGPHWVAAFESALQSDGVQCWDEKTHRPGPEHLVLLRFPEQKVVVVLPVGEVADFQRTNGIHMTDDKPVK